MRRNLKAEMKESMDALHFSQEDKNAMIYNLTAQMKEEKSRKHGGRKLMIVALAATMLLATLTGAAVFTRWSTTAQVRYNPSEDVKEQAEKSGLSVMLEETKGEENPNEVLSVTDQGITITAVQSIVDEYSADLTFKIEGFNLPEDRDPAVWPVITIDGDPHFYTAMEGGFFDGTTRNNAGEWVYASTGEPVKSRDDEYQSVILDWVADDGSMEYTHHISFNETDGRYFGKEIEVKFSFIGVQAKKKAAPEEKLVEGDWTLRWTLKGTSDSITVTPNEKIGDSEVILLDAEIGQKTIYARYKLDDYWDGWNELVPMPHEVYGVRMKDGSCYRCVATTTGFEDQENMIYFTESSMVDAILDVSQVESLMFYKGREKDANGEPTIQTFWYMPIQ
ncbi:MAG: DUF4179 domain-containing protein [Oscillospiraceae bacterium]|nr:DUF4179 domain-containing protein [Oscillospiraceae bacterium]